MRPIIAGILCVLLFCLPNLRGEIKKGETSIALIKEGNKIAGFFLKAKGKPIASIYWDSLGVLHPSRFEEKDNSLIFRDFKTHPSLSLSDSYLRISFSSKDDYPEIYFRLKIKGFDPLKWESAFGKIPFHFLACSLPGASIFQGGGGWSIATPNIDPYPLLGITPEARKIASEWSENWTYAPSIEAHAQPVAGLWHPEKKLYILRSYPRTSRRWFHQKGLPFGNWDELAMAT